MARIGPRLARRKSFGHASDLVTGLMSGLAWKNCWTLAEHLGEQVPYGLQNLLSRGSWDHDGVRDDLRDYVIEQLGHPDGILVVDETGDVKKGTATVGVQRQRTGTAGRVNAQVSVHLTYTSPNGHALIDAELYLPESWMADADRLATVGVPDDVSFATKPQLAKR
jgi:SRSO17 transposase